MNICINLGAEERLPVPAAIQNGYNSPAPQHHYHSHVSPAATATPQPLSQGCEDHWSWNKNDKSHEVNLYKKIIGVSLIFEVDQESNLISS